jgi:pilus assembly protein Flp/PilA
MNEIKKIEQVEVEKKDEKGAAMVEYAIIVALIAVVCIAAVTILGTKASTAFSTAAEKITT